MLRFNIGATDFLADQTPTIVVAGAQPAQRLRLSVQVTDRNGLIWKSVAEYRADAGGVVDVSQASAADGDYQGVDKFAPFYALSPVPLAQQLDYVRRFVQPDIAYEYPYFEPEDMRIFTICAATSDASCEVQITQRFMAAGVTVEDVRTDAGLRGRLYIPAGPVKGAVVCLGGSGGGADRDFAPLLASHGYMALALAYFAYDDLPEILSDIPLEYFAEGVRWLSERSSCPKVALLGTSRGSEAVQLTAVHFPDNIAAVIARVPSFVVTAGARDGRTYVDPTWLKDQQPLEYVSLKFENMQPMVSPHPLELMDVGEVYRSCWVSLADDHPAIIPVEKIAAPMLLISSPDDALWPSGYGAAKIAERIARLRPDADLEHISCAGASHRIKAPGTVTTFSWVYCDAGEFDALGGNPADTAKANESSWQHMLSFLNQVFGG